MSDKATELIELVQNEIAGLDSQFEFWITVTFAVVVASYLARGELPMTVRISITLVYSLAVSLFFSRMSTHAFAARQILSALTEAGVDYPSLVDPVFRNLRAAVVILGSAGAVVFILFGTSITEQSAPGAED